MILSSCLLSLTELGMIGGGKCGGGSSDGSGCSGCGFGTAEGKTAAVNNSTGLMTAGLGGRPLFFLG